MVATSLTLASGGSGGVFGPSMYVGAMLGGAFGTAVHALFPASTAGSGAYALVGIGGVVGGTALAPLTAIILLFETTADYPLIPPVMLDTALSVVVTRTLVGESIYTLKLRRQDIGYYAGAELARTHGATVVTAMRHDLPTLPASSSVLAGLAAAVQARTLALPVEDEHGVLVGAVTVEQLAGAAVRDDRPETIAPLLVPLATVRVAPATRLDAALTRLSGAEHDVLLVAAAEEPLVLQGVLTRRDVLQAYERVIRGSA